MCETIHWFDYISLKINSACLVIRRIKEIHTYDVLTIIIEDLHNEYEVIDKFRGSTTNNGSSDFREISRNRNWMKKMIWFISKSEKLLTLDLTITLTICILLFHFIVDALAILKVWSRKLMLWKFKILAFIIYATLHWQNFSSCGISNHQVLWIQTSLWNILDNYWFLKMKKMWNSEYDVVTYIFRLLKKKSRGMKKIFGGLNLIQLTPNEEQYLKEYSKIMRFCTEALDVLQGQEKIALGYLLPTIFLLKEKLKRLQNILSIKYCQALITGHSQCLTL